MRPDETHETYESNAKSGWRSPRRPRGTGRWARGRAGLRREWDSSSGAACGGFLLGTYVRRRGGSAARRALWPVDGLTVRTHERRS
jgi:hypothetical protein